MQANVSHPIDAQFINNEDNVAFRQRYRSKKGFLTSLSKGKNVTFVHAVDHVECTVIRPHNLEEYRKRK